jgi:hypothetical protein
MAFNGSRMRTVRQPALISSTLILMATNGGYNSSRRASDRILLRAMNAMKRCINGTCSPWHSLAPACLLRSMQHRRSFSRHAYRAAMVR